MHKVATWLAALMAIQSLGASLEELAPRFPPDTVVVWQALTNHLPKGFWTYKRLPQLFSVPAISKAIVLAGFEKKGFPRPSTNEVVLWADHTDMEPRPPNFGISPKYGQLSFTPGSRAPDSLQDIARDAAAVKRALKCAELLGVNPADLVPTNAATAGIGGVFLARRIDGVRFGEGSEGLQMQFGKDGKIRQFALMWPKLDRVQFCATASPSEIIRCIRARRTLLRPVDDEPDYFARLKSLAHAKRLTINRVSRFYGEGVFGEDLPENEPVQHVGPVAELEAIADFGTNSIHVQLLSPILATDVKQLLMKPK